MGYAYVPTFKKHERKIEESSLPDSRDRHHQSEATAAALGSAGYVQIGSDHVALPGDGMVAVQRDGTLRTAGDGQGLRVDRRRRLRAEIIEHIMCDFDADLGPICARHGSAAETMLNSSVRLQSLISDGVIKLDGTALAVSDDSRFLVRSVAAAFDAYLGESGQRHSRAV